MLSRSSRLVLTFVAFGISLAARVLAAAPPDPAVLSKTVDAAKAAATANAAITAKARQRLEALSTQRKALESAIKDAQKAFDAHFRAATQGTGTATGVEHREYRLVKGKLKKTENIEK